jgi:signal transduction histidine kinase
VRLYAGRFYDRGFSRRFFLIEELTDELRQVERAAYEKLVRVMSHEVNNTVAASTSLLHSAMTYAPELGSESRADFERAIEIVIGRTEQLNQFLRRFADIFRLPPPTRSPHDLRMIVASLVTLMSARQDAREIRWTRSLEGEPVVVDVDRAQLEQAVVNVLGNAVEAAGPTGAITVRVSHEDGRPLLVVEDSGPGLTEEARAHLFTPFFSTKARGQGIGLTLVQEILSAHGCDYGLESEAGRPTRFVIRFPRHI